ncbi:uridine diphosphate-N-acetylglucosamine-binding protein YvcK [Frankia sp. AiPa1]|uniref:gluconeogenesis factor YvcK family protein n=1 Tax=Frankia sp. AiPa1 TaxID=573492 RepID=UPI00202B5433|nr:uridine diphosphate-N-acetylglucosamine-binding protein YvcK [Frankia sp. AiPa1]MCL9761344.1 uridine diphosphate-N-acetylglucosamine-binding protein YvcK [Frankia sp. AiPa1]
MPRPGEGPGGSAAARPAPAVVAFGGGHGLAASLAALRRLTPALTAVVTVGDDGGSSGRLRAELGALPMGDLRMALAALAGSDGGPAAWADLFQHRFGGPGPLGGHAVGNLVLTGLAERVGSPVAALDLAAGLLGVRGRVLPLATAGIDIVADVAGLDPNAPEVTSEVRGQAAVATTTGRVRGVRLAPAEPVACREAVAAARAADWLVLGPGSLYTSMLPHLLVPGMRQAITSSRARTLMVLNLAAQPGETSGYTPQAHLEALRRHVPGLHLDVVLADPTAVPELEPLAAAAARLGAQLYLAPVRVPDASVHDPARLAAAFQAVFAAEDPAASAASTASTASTAPAAAVPPAQTGAPVNGAARPVCPSSGGVVRWTSSGEAKE